MKRRTPNPTMGPKIKQQIADLKRRNIASKKVVSLSEYRSLEKENKEPRTILLVDDEEIMRHALQRILHAQGYRVLQAKDGVEFSHILDNTRLDLILLDVNLPGVDGLEICRVIKDNPLLNHIPVIFVSARASEEDIARGHNAGADEYVTKPFEIDYIVNVISRTLQKVGA